MGSASILAIIAAIVMFLPIATFKPHRKTTKWMLIGGIVGFFAAIAITPTPAPSDKPAPAAADKSAHPAVAEDQPVKSADPKPAFLSQYRQLLALAKPCDASIGRVAAEAGRGAAIGMYVAAKDGQAACENAFMKISGMEPEADMPKAAAEEQSKAIDTCKSAYFLRQRAMETAMKVADGDGRASNVVSFKEDLEAGQSGVMLCVAQWMQAGNALGVKPEEFK